MPAKQRLLWAWLAIGLVVVIHEAVTGGGVAGALLLWELNRSGAIYPGLTYVGPAAVLIMAPAFLLMPPRQRRGPRDVPSPVSPKQRWLGPALGIAVALGLAVTAAYAYARLIELPALDAPEANLTVGAPGMPVRPPSGERVVLVGFAQHDLGLSYDDVGQRRHGVDTHRRRVFVPITEAGWTPGQPVRFLAEDPTFDTPISPIRIFDLEHLMDEPEAEETRPGVLSPGVRDWLRQAFAQRGVRLAREVWIHQPDVRQARGDWEALAVIAGMFSPFAVAFGFVWR